MAISSTIKHRIYVSMPADAWLDDRQNDLKWGIVEKIEKLGYEAQIFGGPTGGKGLAAGKAWNLEEVDKVMRRCVGAAIIGLPKWKFSIGDQAFSLPTEYCHYEGAVAQTRGLPILAVAERGIEPRVLFNWHVGLEIIQVPSAATRAWLEQVQFLGPFENWKNKLQDRRDVFIGYCSSSRGTAANVKRYLTRELNATVLDWHEDFAPAGSILEQIQDAASRCSAGVFLFTKDDKVESSGETAVPRDNVVFEAGFFAHAKGKDRVLIIREKGSKMPADLGGDIYASLDDRADITSIEPYIKRFITQRL